MSSLRSKLIAAITCALIACGTNPASAAAVGGPPGGGFFITFLTGADEVPPVETSAFGIATAQISRSGDRITVNLITIGLVDITQAHIHLGAEGVNGPPVAFLFGPADPPVTGNGLLSRTTITVDDLIGPLEGEPLSALIEAMESGDTYVNVHTVANAPGEIRGQL